MVWAGGEQRMVKERNDPERMGLGEFRFHPAELHAVFEIVGMDGTRFGVAGAIEREELSQISIGEVVIAAGLVLRKREIVEDHVHIAMALGFVAVMIAERGKERNAR